MCSVMRRGRGVWEQRVDKWGKVGHSGDHSHDGRVTVRTDGEKLKCSWASTSIASTAKGES